MRSALSNPFRTSRIEGLRFRSADLSVDELGNRLMASAGTHVIAGPHGSGKTTLLLELQQLLRQSGRDVHSFFMNENGPQPALRELLRIRRAHRSDYVLFDGFGHLSRWRTILLVRLASRTSGLVVTAHEARGLPVLHRTSTSPDLLRELLRELHADPEVGVSSNELWKLHNGNIREIFRELYFRHAEIPYVRN